MVIDNIILIDPHIAAFISFNLITTSLVHRIWYIRHNRNPILMDIF